ncbi:MAG: hypothetical protein WBO56_02710, partial [Microgenomates group bacterium]
MNKKFTIIIVVTTVLLVALLIVLGILRSKPQTDSTSDQFASPTNIPNNQRGGGSSRSSSSGSGSGNNNSISGNGTAGNSGRGNGISATPRQVATPTPLPKVKLDALSTIQKFLPYNSDALAVDYSAITNKIYVQKKSEKADEEFQQFLTQNNLVDIYNKSPELFLTSQSILAPIITNEEQKIEFSPEEVKEAVLEPLTSPTSIPNPNDPSKQMLPMVNVFKTLMGLNTILLPPSEIIQSPSTQSTTSPVVPVNINYGKDTTNIPCAAGTDYGPADGYTNGVLTRIRTCRVAGMVVNSQVSKQVSDMHAAWTAAGIPLSGGSFRTMAGQISIYQNWCKIDGIVGSPPPYPKPPGQTIRCPGGGAPGYSNHQMGMAIDFNCAGTLIPRKYAAASQNR